MVVGQELPEGVAVENVRYTQWGSSDEGTPETERYVFDICPRIRDSLDRTPYESA